MQLASVQMNSGDRPEQNLTQLAALLEQAAEQGADLVVLPENFALMGCDQARRRELAEQDGDGQIQNAVAELARKYGIWIVAGTIPIRSNDPSRPFASCCVYDEMGERVGRYDKIHLFNVQLADGREQYSESDFTLPGDKRVVLATPWGRMGLAVCYDLRFPELFRRMSLDGLDFIALPAAFTQTTGQAHWESLLRARAIENQCCVIAAAQTGIHPDQRRTWGHSMIIDAWGRMLSNLGTTIGVACVNIDVPAMAKLRRDFPALDHRRPELFSR